MSEDLFIVDGNTSDYVEQYQNVPSSPGATPIVGISPDRGLFLRILNQISRGDARGVPVYFRPRDSNGDLLAPSSAIYFAIELNGWEEASKASLKRGNISHYVTNDLTTQQNVDNIDQSKIPLEVPETAENGGEPTSHLTVRWTDTLWLMMDAPSAIDWSQSEFYIDTDAVEQGEV
jgi:hypothetical protein